FLPLYLKRVSILFNNREEGLNTDEEFQKILNDPESKWAPTVFDYINFKYGGPGGMNEKSWNDICKFYNYMSLADYSSMSYRASVGRLEEKTLTYNVESTPRSEEHTSELQSRFDLVCRLLLEKKKKRLSAT